MVGGGGCIARADVHDDGPAADTAAVRRQIATKVNAACNPRIIAAIAFVGHERSERPSDTRAVLFAHRRRAARDETSSSNDRRPSGRGGSPCEVCDTETHPCWQCAAYRASRATQAVCIQAAARGSRLLDSPKGGRQQGCGLATEKGVAWPGLAVLGGSGEGPGGTWCMEDGTTSAGSMRFGQSHLLTPTAHLGHPPRQPVSAGDARSGKRREDAACRVSTAHVREGHNAVAVTPARWRVLRESCAR